MNHDVAMLGSVSQMAETHLSVLPAQPALTQNRQGKQVDLKDAAHEFEAYFISHLLKVMRETVPKGALDNKGGAYFYSFYDQEIGRLASEVGGLGLAKMIHEYTERNDTPSSFQNQSPIP
jgi:peptidoglycan hydrolase FlgJ